MHLEFPGTIVPTGRADGAVLVIPGRPVLLEQEMSVKQVARLTGYSERRIYQFTKELRARQRGPRCKVRIPASEVARLMALRA